MFAEDEAALLIGAAKSAEQLESLVVRRIAGFPLEHLLGWAEFRGLRVAVAPDVFVPRQRTGFLVEQAIALGRQMIRAELPSAIDVAPSPGTPTTTPADTAIAIQAEAATPGTSASAMTHAGPLIVLDMCCGSGALGMAFAIEAGAEGIAVELTAADIEPAAVACARRNLAGLEARVFEGDLFAPVPAELAGRVRILLANTPYVPSAAIASMPPEARDHEPRVALDGGADGLDVLRRIAAVAGHWLAPGGHLLVEESEEQAALAAQVMRDHGLSARIAEDDELGATVVIGTRDVGV